MPIEQLSDQRRLSRDFKVRLGVRKVKKTREIATRDTSMFDSYPTETDHFVFDEAPVDVIKSYAKDPKSLRVMLPMEWDAKNPQGEELVFSLYNRAYGRSHGLKCKGTGRSAEFPGTARTSDAGFASAVMATTGLAPLKHESRSGTTFYGLACWGRDCPKFYHLMSKPDPDDPSRTVEALADGHDKDASCRAVAILRCFLLDPQVDPHHVDYCKVLGVMELATSSVNSIIDLQSGFDLLRAYTGDRTAGVPLTLVRKPTVTFKPFRQTHFTLAVHYDQREVQRWSAIPLGEVFLSEDQRTRLKQLQAVPLGLTVDSVRDLIPERLLPEDLRGPTAGATEAEAGSGPGTGASAPDAVAGAPEPAGGASDDSPLLVRAQLEELKWLAGGPEDPEQPYDAITNDWKDSSIARLGACIEAMRNEMGIATPLKLSQLRVFHAEWLKARLRSLAELEPKS